MGRLVRRLMNRSTSTALENWLKFVDDEQALKMEADRRRKVGDAFAKCFNGRWRVVVTESGFWEERRGKVMSMCVCACIRMYVCAYGSCVCVRMCLYACVRVCAFACARVRVCAREQVMNKIMHRMMHRRSAAALLRWIAAVEVCAWVCFCWPAAVDGPLSPSLLAAICSLPTQPTSNTHSFLKTRL